MINEHTRELSRATGSQRGERQSERKQRVYNKEEKEGSRGGGEVYAGEDLL